MDVALLFFLPLLGGFVFVRTSLLTRYAAAHVETGHVYYSASLSGLLFAVLGLVLHVLLAHTSYPYALLSRDLRLYLIEPLLAHGEGPWMPDHSQWGGPVDPRLEVRALLAFASLWGCALGLATPLWNLLLRAGTAAWDGLRRATLEAPAGGAGAARPFLTSIQRIHLATIKDSLERLLVRSMCEYAEILVTLDNAKVYVGYVVEFDPVGPARHVTLQPLMSGYRDAATREVRYTTFHSQVLREALQELGGAAGVRDMLQSFRIVIPIARITTVSGFDLEAFRRFDLAQEGARRRRRARGTPRPR